MFTVGAAWGWANRTKQACVEMSLDTARTSACATLPLDMAAELVAHRGKQLIGEIFLAAGAEPLIKRRAQHGRGGGLVDRRGNGPAALAGIGDMARKPSQIGRLK